MTGFKFFINFKTYPQATGEKALSLAKICEKLTEGQEEVIPIVQAVDLYRVKQSVKIPVWVQHLDWQPPGKFSGWINLESVANSGAVGTLINHSEHPLPPGTIKQIISRIRSKKELGNFRVMICAKTLGQIKRLVKFKPDFLAYEIAELIGSESSICEKAPKAIRHAVEICGPIPLIVGAGIHSREDIVVAKKIGAQGILISSAVVLAENPQKKLEDLR